MDYEYGNLKWSFTGLNQGNPISPILSSLISTSLFFIADSFDSTMYADDGMSYSDKPLPSLGSELLGIEISDAKSHMVREAGVWLRPLKFLGMKWTHKSLLKADSPVYIPSGWNSNLHWRQ